MKLKKVAALGLATAMAFSVTACSSSKSAETTAAAEDAETTAAADGEAVKASELLSKRAWLKGREHLHQGW